MSVHVCDVCFKGLGKQDWPSTDGRRGGLKEGWILSPRYWQPSAAVGKLGSLQGYGSSFISTARLTALHLVAPLTSCWWLQVTLFSHSQPEYISGCARHEAELAAVPLVYGFNQSIQKQLASYLNFKGPRRGHMGTCQREAGNQRGNAARSSPPCWEVIMHRKSSRRNDSSNHDNVSRTGLARLPQGLTLFCTKSIFPFSDVHCWCSASSCLLYLPQSRPTREIVFSAHSTGRATCKMKIFFYRKLSPPVLVEHCAPQSYPKPLPLHVPTVARNNCKGSCVISLSTLLFSKVPHRAFQLGVRMCCVPEIKSTSTKPAFFFFFKVSFWHLLFQIMSEVHTEQSSERLVLAVYENLFLTARALLRRWSPTSKILVE